jgi:hypothetical protein
MLRARLPTCSIAVAETVLARLWCALEAHGLPSPDIEIELGPADTVTLSMEFAQAIDARVFRQIWRSAIHQIEADDDSAD